MKTNTNTHIKRLNYKLKRATFLIFIVALLILTCFSVLPVCAASETSALLKPNENKVERGNTFYYDFELKSNNHIDVGVFRLTVNFDSSKMVCKDVNPTNSTLKEQLKYNIEENRVTIIFIETQGIDVFESSPLNAFSIKFVVLDDADFGTIQMEALIDSVADSEANELSFSSLNLEPVLVVSTKESDCTLKSLETSEGAISPNFNPYITNYTLDVTSSVDRIDVYAEANDETATVTVSRKTLNKAGKSTDIKVTIKSANKKSSLVYVVTVNRLEKASSVGTSTAKSSGGSKISANTKKTSTGSNTGTNASLVKNSVALGANNGKNTSAITVNENRMLPFVVGALVVLLPIGAYYIYTKYKELILNIEIQKIISKALKNYN